MERSRRQGQAGRLLGLTIRRYLLRCRRSSGSIHPGLTGGSSVQKVVDLIWGDDRTEYLVMRLVQCLVGTSVDLVLILDGVGRLFGTGGSLKDISIICDK